MTLAKLSHFQGVGDGLMRIFTQRISAAPLVLPEHSRVRAVRDIREGSESVPAGATGTIVHIVKGGIGYDVEFTSPKHVVISANRSELALA
jgi:hypothetical protein